MSRQRGRGAAAHVEEEAVPPVKTEVKTEDPVKAEEAKQRILSWPQMLTEEMRKRSVVAGTSSDDLPQADEAKPDEAEQQPDAEADEAEAAAEVVEAKPDDVKRSARLAARNGATRNTFRARLHGLRKSAQCSTNETK